MTDQMTALEIVRRAQAPDPFHIIELMRMTNEMLIDIPAYEANSATVNIALQRTIAAMGQHRIYNRGVKKVATQTKPIQDRIAMIAAYSDVDQSMLEHSGNTNAALMSEAAGIIKGMGLTQAETLIYGDGSRDDEFSGLMERRNSLSDSNVIDAGGTGLEGNGNELTSIYIVAVGKDMFHLIYPKGSKSVGVNREDRGKVDVSDGKGGEYPVLRNYFTAQYGLTIIAPDAVKRIANIHAKTIDGNKLIDLIIEARYKLPKGASTYAMYSNVDIQIILDKAARDKGNVVHTTADPWGKPITHVRDLRCRQMDVITNTESRVV